MLRSGLSAGCPPELAGAVVGFGVLVCSLLGPPCLSPCQARKCLLSDRKTQHAMGRGDVLLVLDPAGPGLTLVRGFPWGLTWSQGEPSAHASHSLTPDQAMWAADSQPHAQV